MTTTPVDSTYCPTCQRIGSHASDCKAARPVCIYADRYKDDAERIEAERQERLRRGQRVIDGVCPDWCEGHWETGIAGWEEHRDGVFHRSHSSEPSIERKGVMSRQNASAWVSVDEHEDGTFDPATVTLDVTNTCDLTPDQAREFARDLLRLADWAEYK